MVTYGFGMIGCGVIAEFHTRAIAEIAGARGAGDPRDPSHAGHREQLSEFLHAIDEDRPPRVDGREGRKAVEIIRAIYRSASTGQAVALPFENHAG